MKANVIISIYNHFDRLELVLAGFEVQSEKDFEVILADDGSNEQTVSAILEYQKKSPLRIRHVRHEDKGFLKTTILNSAVMAAATEYLIFVDGDCIPHRHYVREHLKHRRENTILTGRRVMLSKKLSEQLNPEKIRKGQLENGFFRKMLLDAFTKGGTKRVKQGLYIQNKMMEAMLPQKHKGLLGCNFSLHKKDLLEINGFDERYASPGVGEDTDIEYRLSWLGKSFVSIKNYAIQYHLWHKLLERQPGRHDLLAQVVKAKNPVTHYGIDQHNALPEM